VKGVSGEIFDWAPSQLSLTGHRVHSSPVKGVSGEIFDWAPSQLSLTVRESTGLWGLTNPFVTCENSFEGNF